MRQFALGYLNVFRRFAGLGVSSILRFIFLIECKRVLINREIEGGFCARGDGGWELNGVRLPVYSAEGVLLPHNTADRPEGSPEENRCPLARAQKKEPNEPFEASTTSPHKTIPAFISGSAGFFLTW